MKIINSYFSLNSPEVPVKHSHLFTNETYIGTTPNVVEELVILPWIRKFYNNPCVVLNILNLYSPNKCIINIHISGKRKDHKGGNRSSRVQPSTPNRSRRSLWFDQHDIHHIEYHENQCNHHRLDHCAWPQCNLSCPKIHNPFTGEEMDFIDLLLQFGLDLTSIANALGMDLPTLQSMDHDLLLRKLIQQS